MSSVNCNRCSGRAVVLARTGGTTDDNQSGTQEFLCNDCRRQVPAPRADANGNTIPGQLIRLVEVLGKEAL